MKDSLYDVMLGDSTLFSRDDEVETAWKFLEPIQKAWANNPRYKNIMVIRPEHGGPELQMILLKEMDLHGDTHVRIWQTMNYIVSCNVEFNSNSEKDSLETAE